MPRTLIIIGLCIVAIRRETFSFYFPIATMTLISVVLSAMLWLFNR
ncbi:DUF2905 domain-containing protein [Halomonas sp. DQ26W]|nr:DUF2905 family protein [Halomonas sp. DQ26W]RDB41892.1 DUF2905 domain-containing protein [Halomonas sp. DQ26W]